MVVAGQKVYMATKGIWLWPNRRCMLVVTKRILWPNISWMDDCGHSRRMVLATHEAYDHGPTQVVSVHTLGLWIWPHKEYCYGQTKCMIVGTFEVYGLGFKKVVRWCPHWEYGCGHTRCVVMAKHKV
jgi:hypothetical protein